MDRIKLMGHMMAWTGLFMVLTNAFNYLFGWNSIQPSFGIIGLVFAAIGFKIIRK